MYQTLPETIKVSHNFGNITVVFEGEDTKNNFTMNGDNAIVDGDKSEIIKWLKPFDGIAVGCGTPQLEQFEIVHIKDGL